MYLRVYTDIHICMCVCVCVFLCACIYIERESARLRAREGEGRGLTHRKAADRRWIVLRIKRRMRIGQSISGVRKAYFWRGRASQRFGRKAAARRWAALRIKRRTRIVMCVCVCIQIYRYVYVCLSVCVCMHASIYRENGRESQQDWERERGGGWPVEKRQLDLMVSCTVCCDKG